MTKFNLFGKRTSAETEREREHRLLAREAAQEGIVLLENKGILPLQPQNVALYGAGARRTVTGGTGSGETAERHSVSIEEGLLHAGFAITNQQWLDRYDELFDVHKSEWREEIEGKIIGFTLENVLQMFEIVHASPLSLPIGPLIKRGELDSTTETAIYVITRQAGEGKDRQNIEGDYKLDSVEVSNLRILSEYYKNVVVIINCGGLMDLTELDTMSNIQAIIHLGQCGSEGGHALADIMSGQVTPSGKLTDTWAHSYNDYPTAHKELQMHEDQADYLEGIYVGYRYFDSFNINARYPFGYGLSYTEFSIVLDHIRLYKGKLTLELNITNVGNQYCGKEVVQVYISKAHQGKKCEFKRLVTFGKTERIAPGDSQTLHIELPLNELAAFSEELNAWIVEADDYGLYVGNSSYQAALSSVLEVRENIVIERVEKISDQDLKNHEWEREIQTRIFPMDVPRLVIGDEFFEVIEHEYDESHGKSQLTINSLIESLAEEDLCKLCVGGGQFGITYNITPGAVGWTTTELMDKGIPNINFSDGPAGLNLITESVIEADGTHKYLNALPEKQRWGFVKEMETYALGSTENGTPVYQDMTAWPAVHVQAQTWNQKLSEKIGEAIGKEMLETGVTLWLAPAINIHRDPLCGRNFEYYSEDPLLSGKMAAAVTRGVQSFDGIGTTLKHFCCNNQENRRNWVSANVSEKTLREIYLKGFRYVIAEAAPKAVMSSYNKVNGEYVVNNKNLLVNVLRREWNFKGLVMSDWHSTGEGKADYALSIKSGNDLIMPGNPDVVPALLKAIDEDVLSVDELKWCAQHVLELVFESDVYKKDLQKSI